MGIGEVVQKLREGEKLRRQAWVDESKYIYLRGQSINCSSMHGALTSMYGMYNKYGETHADLMADDWTTY